MQINNNFGFGFYTFLISRFINYRGMLLLILTKDMEETFSAC